MPRVRLQLQLLAKTRTPGNCNSDSTPLEVSCHHSDANDNNGGCSEIWCQRDYNDQLVHLGSTYRFTILVLSQCIHPFLLHIQVSRWKKNLQRDSWYGWGIRLPLLPLETLMNQPCVGCAWWTCVMLWWHLALFFLLLFCMALNGFSVLTHSVTNFRWLELIVVFLKSVIDNDNQKLNLNSR